MAQIINLPGASLFSLVSSLLLESIKNKFYLTKKMYCLSAGDMRKEAQSNIGLQFSWRKIRTEFY